MQFNTVSCEEDLYKPLLAFPLWSSCRWRNIAWSISMSDHILTLPGLTVRGSVQPERWLSTAGRTRGNLRQALALMMTDEVSGRAQSCRCQQSRQGDSEDSGGRRSVPGSPPVLSRASLSLSSRHCGHSGQTHWRVAELSRRFSFLYFPSYQFVRVYCPWIILYQIMKNVINNHREKE